MNKIIKDKRFPETKPQCGACNSYQVYYGKRKQEFTCRVCGNVWEKLNVCKQ